MTKRLITAFAVLIMLAGTVWASEPIKLKFATFEPPQSHANVNIWKPWIERVNKASEGTMKIELFASGTLGRDPKQQLKLVTDGVADIAWIIPAYQPGRFPDDAVTNIPFTAENTMEGSLAISRMSEKGLLRGCKGFVVLAHATLPIYNIHATFPVKIPKDLKGKKIRTAGEIGTAIIKAVGGTPVAIPTPKTAEALSRGVIQATIHEWSALITFRMNEITRYHCMVPFGTYTVMVGMNQKRYDSLPPKAKAALDNNTGEQLVRIYAKAWGGYDEKIDAQTRKDPKHTVYTPSAAEMKEWDAIIKPAINSWKNKNQKNEDTFKTYVSEIAKVRAEK